MKKIFALLLAAVMVVCSCAALAETEAYTIEFDDSLSFKVVLPEGYACAENVENGVLSAMIFKDEDSLAFAMVIAGDDEYDETARLNDLSDDEKTAFATAMLEDLGNPTWTISTTGLGTELIVVAEENDEEDLAMMATLYDGCDIVLYVGYADGRTVTADDMAVANQFFTDLEFVKADK